MTRAAVRTKATVVFGRPFRLPGLDEVLPEGSYLVELDLQMPVGLPEPEEWRASALVHLHRQVASPDLARTLTIPLVDLEQALEEDRESASLLAARLLDEMLADPMVRLIMASDNVTEDQIRQLFPKPPTDLRP